MTKFFLLLMAALIGANAFAQFRVEVSGAGLTQFPIAVTPFKGNDGMTQRMANIVLADLERSGQFRSVDAGSIPMDENVRPELPVWRKQGADALVTGSVSRVGEDRYEVRFRLWDAVRNQDLGGLSQVAPASELRRAAHRVSDWVYEKLTGEKGVFSTRIAYVTKNALVFNLWVADSDGEGAQSALSSAEPIISPAWAPNGNQLAYVSFESRKPVVYVHEIDTGKRRLVSNFKGSNSAPAWSPDGKTLALTLSREGGSQLFLLDANASGQEPKRLASSTSIDTEPVFSPDGQTIYFVSDRVGSPQIYKIPVSGGNAERVTGSGNYNISPSVSPDGRWLAYISRVAGAYKLYLQDLSSGQAQALTDTIADESPSFAPNGRMIIYATQQQGRETLMSITLDGRVKARLAGRIGDLREPAWGPLVSP